MQGVSSTSVMRTDQWKSYFLVQYRDNGSKAIKIYDNENEVHRNSDEAGENMKQVLRKINLQEGLNIQPHEEKNTRHFADIILNKLGVKLLL